MERRADADDARVQVAALKRAQPVATQTPDTVKLPKTATDAELKMIAGFILLALSLIWLAFNRRRMVAALTPTETEEAPQPPPASARGLPVPQGRARDFFQTRIVIPERREA